MVYIATCKASNSSMSAELLGECFKIRGQCVKLFIYTCIFFFCILTHLFQSVINIFIRLFGKVLWSKKSSWDGHAFMNTAYVCLTVTAGLSLKMKHLKLQENLRKTWKCCSLLLKWCIFFFWILRFQKGVLVCLFFWFVCFFFGRWDGIILDNCISVMYGLLWVNPLGSSSAHAGHCPLSLSDVLSLRVRYVLTTSALLTHLCFCLFLGIWWTMQRIWTLVSSIWLLICRCMHFVIIIFLVNTL